MPSAYQNAQTGIISLLVHFSHDKPLAGLPNQRDGLVIGELVTTGNQATALKHNPYHLLMRNFSIRSDRPRKNSPNSTSNHHATWLMKLTCFNTAHNGLRKKKISSNTATVQSMKYVTTDHSQDNSLFHNSQDAPPREEPFLKAPTLKDP